MQGTDEMTEGRPERTCVGCRVHEASVGLLRLAVVPDHDPLLVPDLAGKLGGRGVWLHARRDCLRKALHGGFARALRRSVALTEADVLPPLQTQLTRRAQGLLLAAMRRRRVALGTDAVLLALATCPVSLILVAKDAAGRREDIVTSASQRRVAIVELFEKEELGKLAQKEALSFVAVLDPQIGREIADSARWLAGLSEDG